MIEVRDNRNTLVNRRIDTLVTHHPGYIETQQVVRDIAPESQLELYLFHRVLWTMLTFLEILLTFRFCLRLIGANPDSGFGVLIYGLSGLFTAPFNSLIPTPGFGGVLIELTTLIAMGFYAFLFWAIEYLVRLLADLTFIRAFTRTTRGLPEGSDEPVRTTRTTITNGRW